MDKDWLSGILGYNAENKRYGLLKRDLWEIDGFHCGKRLQVKIDGEWIDTRMEMDWVNGQGVWCLVDTPLRGTDLEKLSVRIHIGCPFDED